MKMIHKYFFSLSLPLSLFSFSRDIELKLGDDSEHVTPRSDEEEDDLPEDPDSRSTSVLVRDAQASSGLTRTRKKNGEVEIMPAPKKARGVRIYFCQFCVFFLELISQVLHRTKLWDKERDVKTPRCSQKNRGPLTFRMMNILTPLHQKWR